MSKYFNSEYQAKHIEVASNLHCNVKIVFYCFIPKEHYDWPIILTLLKKKCINTSNELSNDVKHLL